jgi:hypothetical protein
MHIGNHKSDETDIKKRLDIAVFSGLFPSRAVDAGPS